MILIMIKTIMINAIMIIKKYNNKNVMIKTIMLMIMLKQ